MSKFQWNAGQIGYSLAFVGLVMAFAQGVLTRALIPRLGGERHSAAVGMAFAICAYVGFAFATRGWMMYVVSALAMFFAMTYPSLNALMSRQVPHNAQGELQGAVACVYSLSSVVGPPLMTQIFARFSSPAAPIYFPGAAFLAAAVLTLGSAALFGQAMRLETHPAPIV
jgi:DHA1 family tetracycline resistance protein-like MFS transporter